MASEKHHQYEPVGNMSDYEGSMSDSGSIIDSEQWGDSGLSQGRSAFRRAWLPWLLHAVLMSITITSSIFSLSRSTQSCVEKVSTYSPGLDAIKDDEYQTIRFQGSFGLPSPYKGPPTPEVDARWREIDRMGTISISEEDFQKINASKHAVKVPSDLGGGYMALPEFVHQLHCVKILWEHTWPEYYTEAYERSQRDPEEFHEHHDHCADLLRQKLMCDADMTMITYNWIKNHYQPHPNFNTQHKCRNYEAARDWTFQRQIDASSLEHNYFTRPAHPVVDFESPPFDPFADE